MIKVYVTDNSIELTGHAERDGEEPGHNIVCAAASMLTYNLELSIKAICPNEDVDITDNGDVFSFKWHRLGSEASTLVQSFVVGVMALADAYPERVTICRNARPSIDDDKSNGN